MSSAFYDVVAFGETLLRFSPPAGRRLEDSLTLDVHVAGSESNVLSGLSRLGLQCSWLSALPTNSLGRRVAGELRRHGVDTGGVVWTGEEARLGTFFAEESPAPVGVNVFYDRAGSAFSLMAPDTLDLSHVDRARFVHLSGITPALGSNAKAAFARLLQKATDTSVPISFDVNYRAKLWSSREAAAAIEEACAASSLVFCTLDDAATLWGFTGSPEAVLQEMAKRFGEEKTMVLTLGDKGSAELRDGHYDEAMPFPSEGSVRFGSGDAFAAGYLYAHLESTHSDSLREKIDSSALEFGNAVASLKRCIPGDIATITLDEVFSVLQGKELRFR